MADIIVNTYGLNQYAERLSSVNERISKLDVRITSLYFQVGVLELWDLLQADTLIYYNWKLARCEDYLCQTAIDIDKNEKNLLGYKEESNGPLEMTINLMGFWWGCLDKARYSGIKDVAEGVVTFLIGFGVAESALSLLSNEGVKSLWGDWIEGYVENLKKIPTELDYAIYKDKKILSDKNHLNNSIKQKKYKREEWQRNSDEKWYKEKGKLVEIKQSIGDAGSVFNGNIVRENDWLEGSITAKGFTGEYHLETRAGLYVYEKDKKGNTQRVFSPGISAEVGTSAAVFDAEINGRTGLGENHDMLGLYGEAELEVLEAEAKFKASLNSEEVYIGGNAEVNLVEVGGTSGVSVLGTDIGVNGSLKVGFGGHAEVGYTDGKFKVDVGLAAGLGFDLGVEVDVSGTVDAICDFSEALEDATAEARNTLGEISSTAVNLGREVGKGILEGISKGLGIY